jgi:hypothetical protein
MKTHGSSYCQNHECKAGRCIRRARQQGGFCPEHHACAKQECKDIRHGTSYCTSHQCAGPDCRQRARDNGAFCAQYHACGVSACEKQRTESPPGTMYCSDHGCRQARCPGLSKGGGGGYCEQFGHACVEGACKDLRYLPLSANPLNLCSKHLLDNRRNSGAIESPQAPVQLAQIGVPAQATVQGGSDSKANSTAGLRVLRSDSWQRMYAAANANARLEGRSIRRRLTFERGDQMKDRDNKD